jgi:hypothetical protein
MTRTLISPLEVQSALSAVTNSIRWFAPEQFQWPPNTPGGSVQHDCDIRGRFRAIDAIWNLTCTHGRELPPNSRQPSICSVRLSGCGRRFGFIKLDHTPRATSRGRSRLRMSEVWDNNRRSLQLRAYRAPTRCPTGHVSPPPPSSAPGASLSSASACATSERSKRGMRRRPRPLRWRSSTSATSSAGGSSYRRGTKHRTHGLRRGQPRWPARERKN